MSYKKVIILMADALFLCPVCPQAPAMLDNLFCISVMRLCTIFTVAFSGFILPLLMTLVLYLRRDRIKPAPVD